MPVLVRYLVGVACAVVLMTGCGEGIDLSALAQSRATGQFERTLLVTGPVDLDVRTGSGDVRVRVGPDDRVVKGAVSARAGSGDIEIEGAGGGLDAQAGSGDIRASAVGGAVNVRVGSGSINVAQTVSGEVDVRAGSGDVSVALPRDAAVTLSLQTGSGSIDSALPVQFDDQRHRNRIEGVVRGGGTRVDIRTGSGSIHIQ